MQREANALPGIGQRKPREGKNLGEANRVLKSAFHSCTLLLCKHFELVSLEIDKCHGVSWFANHHRTTLFHASITTYCKHDPRLV